MSKKQKKNKKYKDKQKKIPQGNISKNQNSISIVSDKKYVKETEITLSDTMLKTALLKSYERGVSDNKKRKNKMPYSIFWSSGVSLLLSNLTADFEKYQWAKDMGLTRIMWITMWICFGLALLFTIIAVICQIRRNGSEIEDRDKAVEEIFSSMNFSDE